MSWRQICKIHGASKHSIPKWNASPASRQLAILARQRIFGGLPLEGMSETGRSIGIGAKNRLLLSKPDKEGRMNQLNWPFVKPEILSGRAYREREKLAAKVQSGEKGAAKGMVQAEKEAKKKKSASK